MDVSIIIPTCNRSESLRQLLASLSQMNGHPDDYEIVVVDNDSKDRTRQVVEEIALCESGPTVRYFFEPVPGLLAARHRGALEAQGEIYAFLDDDVHVHREWLVGLQDGFDDPTVVLLGGPSCPIFQQTPPDWLGGFYFEDEYGRHCASLSLLDGGDRIKPIDARYIWGLNFSIRKTTLFDAGGFHPDTFPKPLQRYQGDGETGLSLNIAKNGLKSLYHPQVLVHHNIPPSRITVGYFQQRAFFQGVCDSYSRIRANGKLELGVRSFKAFLHPIKHVIEGLRGRSLDLWELKRRTSKAYQAGFEFHQREVSRDSSLLEWVLRKDYWDYSLPKDWDSFLPNSVFHEKLVPRAFR